MPRTCVAALATLVIGGLLSSPASAAQYGHLDPGATKADLDEQVPVNVVFVGIDPDEVSEAEFLAGLPERYKPVVRSRLWYGSTEPLGIDYTYDYSLKYTSRAWENEFFGALDGLAEPAPRTEFQEIYNDQDGTRDVGENHFIDAPTTEKWLIDHAPAGVNTRRDTIFFVDWWGRSDFIDHVYTKIGEPDPDTGFDFGLNHESRKIIAWGGTTPDDEETGLGGRGEQRVWFFDLSAGPESWGGSYDISNRDLDGDGVRDYRIPVAWEYAPGGYRSPPELASDLSKVTRYAAINLMFTSSPIYPPYLTPRLLPSALNLDLNTYEGWPGVDASALYQKPRYLRNEEGELFPSTRSADTQDLSFNGRARQCYEQWVQDVPCYPNRPQYPGFANLFVFNALNLEDALDQDLDARTRRYEAPSFNYATTNRLAPALLGFADDNWVDGTQSFIFNFISPAVVEAGYGLTTTQIHEYGHHFGMSHPHDGFDWQSGTDYGPTGRRYFAWSANEHNSVMSYIDLNWDFSQFDRDNADRHQAAAFILNANAIAGRIVDSDRTNRAKRDLRAADRAIGRAELAIESHDYPRTAQAARRAYEYVLEGANAADVNVRLSHNGWAVQSNEVINKSSDAVSRSSDDPNNIVLYGAFDRIGPGTKRSTP